MGANQLISLAAPNGQNDQEVASNALSSVRRAYGKTIVANLIFINIYPESD